MMLCPSAIASEHAVADRLDRPAQPGAAVGDLEEDRQGDGPEAAASPLPPSEGADLLQLLVATGPGRAAPAGGPTRGSGSSRLPSGPDRRLDGHDDLLADGVDRRVGDLGEELLEVAVEQLRPLGEHRERRVVAHRADRLGAGGGHRVDEHADVLGGVAEDLLAAQHGLVVRAR